MVSIFRAGGRRRVGDRLNGDAIRLQIGMKRQNWEMAVNASLNHSANLAYRY